MYHIFVGLFSGSGSIDYQDFLSLVSKSMKQECADEEYAAVFRVYDSDGNGVITSDEFRAAMNSMGENLSKLEAGEMIVEADSDGDGQIDLKGTCKHKVFNSKLQKIHTIRSMIFNLVLK